MDPIWGCDWCQHLSGTCDCIEFCGAQYCEINAEEDDEEYVTEEEFDHMMRTAARQMYEWNRSWVN